MFEDPAENSPGNGDGRSGSTGDDSRSPPNLSEISSEGGETVDPGFEVITHDEVADLGYDFVFIDEVVDLEYEMDSDDEERQWPLNLETEDSLERVTEGKTRLTAMDLILVNDYFASEKTYRKAEIQPDSGKEAISKEPWVGEKESMIVLVTRYETSQFEIPLRLQRLGSQYSSYRRFLEDGNTFYRAFMHAYLEYILKSRDAGEIARIKESVKQCKLAIGNVGYELNNNAIDKILEELNKVIQNAEGSVAPVYLLLKARAPNVSECVVEFFRYATAAEIRKRSKVFKSLKIDLEKAVLPMGSEADENHIKAFCSALGVKIRIIHLDRPKLDNTYPSMVYSGSIHSRKSGLRSTSEGTTDSGDIQALVTLAFNGKRYDILYPKKVKSPD